MREMRFASQLTPREEASDKLCTASDRSARLFENTPPRHFRQRDDQVQDQGKGQPPLRRPGRDMRMGMTLPVIVNVSMFVLFVMMPFVPVLFHRHGFLFFPFPPG
jgi:hypothetical protein